MKYRVEDGAKLTEGDVTVTGPCDLPADFGTDEQRAFWLTCHAIAPVEIPSEAPEALTRAVRSGASRGRS